MDSKTLDELDRLLRSHFVDGRDPYSLFSWLSNNHPALLAAAREAEALREKNAALVAAMGEIRDNPLREHYCACADNARRALAKAREVKP